MISDWAFASSSVHPMSTTWHDFDCLKSSRFVAQCILNKCIWGGSSIGNMRERVSISLASDLPPFCKIRLLATPFPLSLSLSPSPSLALSACKDKQSREWRIYALCEVEVMVPASTLIIMWSVLTLILHLLCLLQPWGQLSTNLSYTLLTVLEQISPDNIRLLKQGIAS